MFPVAALEQHGHHLPVFTDSLLLGEIVRRVSGNRSGDRVLFAPLMWLGNSDHHLDFAGTLSAAPRVYLDLLNGLAENFLAARLPAARVRQRPRRQRRARAGRRSSNCASGTGSATTCCFSSPLTGASARSRGSRTRRCSRRDGPRLRMGDVDDAAARARSWSAIYRARGAGRVRHVVRAGERAAGSRGSAANPGTSAIPHLATAEKGETPVPRCSPTTWSHCSNG